MVVLRMKCILWGAPTVGKSAISQVFHSDGAHYPKNYAMTVGAELLVKSVNIPETEGTSVDMYVVDTAGQSMYDGYVEKYWDTAAGVAIVYDVTNQESFENAKRYFKRIRKARAAAEDDSDMFGVLIGNKTDLTDRRKISTRQGKELAQQLGLEYFECSALKSDGVETPFHFLASRYHGSYQASVGEAQAQCEFSTTDG